MATKRNPKKEAQAKAAAASQPEAAAAPRPQVKPGKRPSVKSAGKPVAKPAAKSAGKPASAPAGTPTASASSAKPATAKPISPSGVDAASTTEPATAVTAAAQGSGRIPLKTKPRPKLRAKDKEKAVAASAAALSQSGKIQKKPDDALDEGNSANLASKDAADSANTAVQNASEQAPSKQPKKPAVAKRSVAKPAASKAGKTKEGAEEDASEAAKPKKKRHVVRYVMLSLVAILLIVVAVFSWDRWLHYDDTQGFQGEWLIDNSTKTVLIDDKTIQLTDDVSYDYKIDSGAKTISFTFGTLSGSGRYRFSEDRKQLVVTEGGSHSLLSTLLEDIGHKWDTLVRAVQGQEPENPNSGEGVIVFERPSSGIVAPPENPAPAPESDPAAGEAEGEPENPSADESAPNNDAPAVADESSADKTAPPLDETAANGNPDTSSASDSASLSGLLDAGGTGA